MNPCIFTAWHWPRFLGAGETLRHRSNLCIFLLQRSSLAIAKKYRFCYAPIRSCGSKKSHGGCVCFCSKGVDLPAFEGFPGLIGDRKTTKTLLSSYLNHNMIPSGQNMREMMMVWVD